MSFYRYRRTRRFEQLLAATVTGSLLLFGYYTFQVRDSDLYRYFHRAESMAPAVLITGFLAGFMVQRWAASLSRRWKGQRRSRQDRTALWDARQRAQIMAAGYYLEATRDTSSSILPPPHPSRYLLARFEFPLHHSAEELILRYGSLGFGNFVIDANAANVAIRYRQYFLDAGLSDALPIGTNFAASGGTGIWVAADGRIFELDRESIGLLGKSASEAIERMVSESPIPPKYPRWKFDDPLKPVPFVEAIPGPWNFASGGESQQASTVKNHRRAEQEKRREDYLRSYAWENYTHAYGSAGDAPAFLADLTSEDEDARAEAINHFLWSAAYHQFDVYTVTPLVIRYVIMVLDDDDSFGTNGEISLAHELVHFCYCCARGQGQAEVMVAINQALRGGRKTFLKWAGNSHAGTAKEASFVLDYLQKTGSETPLGS